MPFKMHEIIIVSRKKIIKKKHVCLSYPKFSDPLPEIHLFFIWPYSGMMGNQFGMNLANQAMNMGMNQGNMGMMGNMQRMSPGGQGGGQFNDGGMRPGLGGGEEGARKRRNRKKNKGGAMG